MPMREMPAGSDGERAAKVMRNPKNAALK